MSYRAMDRVSEAQEARTAKAISEGPDMQWRKSPAGWVVETAGGCYEVTERSCSCPDHQRRCAGTEIRCKHRVALAIRLAEDAARIAPPVVADKEAARIAREDAIFERLYGNG